MNFEPAFVTTPSVCFVFELRTRELPSQTSLPGLPISSILLELPILVPAVGASHDATALDESLAEAEAEVLNA